MDRGDEGVEERLIGGNASTSVVRLGTSVIGASRIAPIDALIRAPVGGLDGRDQRGATFES